MIVNGLSLWFKPEGDVFLRLQKLIRSLAQEYRGPVFLPHVTLLGTLPLDEEEAVAAVRGVAQRHKPFTIELQEVGYENIYFKTFYIHAKKTPELMAIHEDTVRECKIEKSEPYLPHLSLMYGEYQDSLKEKIIAEIGKNQETMFEVNKITMIRSTGDESTWTAIHEFPLG